jgi:hypothetical protein
MVTLFEYEVSRHGGVITGEVKRHIGPFADASQAKRQLQEKGMTFQWCSYVLEEGDRTGDGEFWITPDLSDEEKIRQLLEQLAPGHAITLYNEEDGVRSYRLIYGDGNNVVFTGTLDEMREDLDKEFKYPKPRLAYEIVELAPPEQL